MTAKPGISLGSDVVAAFPELAPGAPCRACAARIVAGTFTGCPAGCPKRGAESAAEIAIDLLEQASAAIDSGRHAAAKAAIATARAALAKRNRKYISGLARG